MPQCRPSQPRRGRPVERHPTKLGQAGNECREVSRLNLSELLVEATLSPGTPDHVPQGDPPLHQQTEPIVIIELGQRLAEHVAHQPPEVISGMRIVTLHPKGFLARKAAENQQPGVRHRNRREPLLHIRHPERSEAIALLLPGLLRLWPLMTIREAMRRPFRLALISLLSLLLGRSSKRDWTSGPKDR